jgi:hypothetical protein
MTTAIINTTNFKTTMTSERQNRCFDAYTAVYKDNAYSSKEHRGWVQDMMLKYPELCQTTLVYHNEDRQDGYTNRMGERVYGTDDKIIDCLKHPIPVYWGRPMTDLFDWAAVRRGLGYNEAQASSMPEELRDTVRYAIVGKVKVKAHGEFPERDSHVIHTEGINLESSETSAFKAMIPGKRKDDILLEYFNRHRSMLKLIIEAAMSQTADGEHAFIQAPMIGAGCFLRGVEDTDLDINDFLEQQVSAMVSVLNMAPPEYNFTYKLCIFNTGEFSNEIVAAYQKLAETDKRFNIGLNRDGGNVLSNVPFAVPNQKVFVVNAGDLRSCIGNGMSHENSVEGFIVANAKGYNPQWQNTSFLHNAYFNPDIFRPKEAATRGHQVWKETMSW